MSLPLPAGAPPRGQEPRGLPGPDRLQGALPRARRAADVRFVLIFHRSLCKGICNFDCQQRRESEGGPASCHWAPSPPLCSNPHRDCSPPMAGFAKGRFWVFIGWIRQQLRKLRYTPLQPVLPKRTSPAIFGRSSPQRSKFVASRQWRATSIMLHHCRHPIPPAPLLSCRRAFPTPPVPAPMHDTARAKFNCQGNSIALASKQSTAAEWAPLGPRRTTRGRR